MNRRAIIAAIILITMAGGKYAVFETESHRGTRIPAPTRDIEMPVLPTQGEITGGQTETERQTQENSNGGQPASRGGQSRIYAGEFEITAYTAGPESTGKSPGHPEYGITASGKKVQEEITIAADWDVLPNGTVVWIEGVGRRVVHDTGSAIKGHRLDLYMPELKDALNWGRQKRKVFILQ